MNFVVLISTLQPFIINDVNCYNVKVTYVTSRPNSLVNIIIRYIYFCLLILKYTRNKVIFNK